LSANAPYRRNAGTPPVFGTVRVKIRDIVVKLTPRGFEHGQQRQEQYRYRRRVQDKIKKAVHQHRQAAGKRPHGDAAAKNILPPRVTQPRPEQPEQKQGANYRSYDARVRNDLQVIVVGLFDQVHAARRIVLSICLCICPNAGTEGQVIFDYLERDFPDMGPTRRNVLRRGGLGYPCQRRVSANKDRSADSRCNQQQRENDL